MKTYKVTFDLNVSMDDLKNGNLLTGNDIKMLLYVGMSEAMPLNVDKFEIDNIKVIAPQFTLDECEEIGISLTPNS